MECPKCGSEDNTEKLDYPDISENRTEYFKNKYPYIFEFDNYEGKSYKIYILILVYGILGGFISLAGICGLITGDANAIIVISLGISSVTAIYYIRRDEVIIEKKEDFIVHEVKDKNYCKKDDLFFDKDGIIEVKKINQIEEELSHFYSNVRPWHKRISLASGLLALSTVIFINTPISDGGKDSKKVSKERDLISREKVDVGSIQLGPRLLDPGEVNGRYSFPVGKGLDISVVFVTWNKFEDMGVDVPNKYDKKYNEYDGLFYAYESSEAGLLLGAWKLSNRMIDGFRQKFVFINAAKFRDGSVGDKDFGILYGEGEGPSLAIHVRGNRFFSAYPKKNLPRSRSFYSD